MSDAWGVTRTKNSVTEYLKKDKTWVADKGQAEPMDEEYAKGAAYGLSITEIAKKQLDPYVFEVVHLDTSI